MVQALILRISQCHHKADARDQESCYIFTREEAERLVTEALDTVLDEPEPFVRLLLILLDNAREPRLDDAIRLLIKVAYDGSIVHSIDLDEYIESIRAGQNTVDEVRARWLGRHKSEPLSRLEPPAVLEEPMKQSRADQKTHPSDRIERKAARSLKVLDSD